jgi:hypothetical protein
MIDAIVSMYYDTKAEMLGGAASRLLELQSQVVNFKYLSMIHLCIACDAKDT